MFPTPADFVYWKECNVPRWASGFSEESRDLNEYRRRSALHRAINSHGDPLPWYRTSTEPQNTMQLMRARRGRGYPMFKGLLEGSQPQGRKVYVTRWLRRLGISPWVADRVVFDQTQFLDKIER